MIEYCSISFTDERQSSLPSHKVSYKRHNDNMRKPSMFTKYDKYLFTVAYNEFYVKRFLYLCFHHCNQDTKFIFAAHAVIKKELMLEV